MRCKDCFNRNNGAHYWTVFPQRQDEVAVKMTEIVV